IDFNVVLNRLEEFEYTSFKELFAEVLGSQEWTEFNPTIIGISALFGPAYQNMLDLGACGRERFPEAWMLGGGFLPTNMYQQIFADTQDFHGLCFGEGERALVRFIQAENKSEFLETDTTWITKEKARAKAHS